MPFKLNHDRRRHIPRQKHKVTNSAAYDAVLCQRGSLTVRFTDEAVESWRAAPRTAPGGQPCYSPLAILTALTLRAVFRLALRQTEGLIGSIIGLLGLQLRVPDYSALSRRAETLEVPRPQPRRNGEPLHLLVDSTGLHLCGAGEWLLEKHGTKTRRPWRKLHIGVDTGTGRIVAASLTAKEVDDGAEVGPLLDQVTGVVTSFIADGGYDQDRVYDSGAERHGRDRAHAARPSPAAHRQAQTHGVAEGVRLHDAGQGRDSDRTVQAGDRGRAALAHGVGVGRPRWAPPSTRLTAWWSSDARTTSALPDLKQGWGCCARSAGLCNTLIRAPTPIPIRQAARPAPSHASRVAGSGCACRWRRRSR